jgi:hypothetical protein
MPPRRVTNQLQLHMAAMHALVLLLPLRLLAAVAARASFNKAHRACAPHDNKHNGLPDYITDTIWAMHTTSTQVGKVKLKSATCLAHLWQRSRTSWQSLLSASCCLQAWACPAPAPCLLRPAHPASCAAPPSHHW